MYNQNKYGIGPDCVPTTCMQILKNKYGIDCKYTLLNKIVIKALQVKVLFKSGGAKFETYYNWFVGEINKQTGLNFKIDKQDLTNIYFKESLDNNGFYGLRLKNGNETYLNAVNKGEITNEDIINIMSEGGGFQHNNCYGKNTIYEVYGGHEVNMSLDTLIFGVNMGIFGSIGRDIIPNDSFTADVCNLLIAWRDEPTYDPYASGKTSDYYIKVMNKAADILLDYEIRPKYGLD